MQAINLLQGLIPGEDAPRQADAAFLEKLFVFSLMWSIGASLELGDRKKVRMDFILSSKNSLGGGFPGIVCTDNFYIFLTDGRMVSREC
jgi:hypothetical protein